MFWIFLLGLIAVIVLSQSTKKHTDEQIEQQLLRRNDEWVQFIISYQQIAQTAKEKALLARLLTDIKEQNLGYVDDHVLHELAQPAAAAKNEALVQAADKELALAPAAGEYTLPIQSEDKEWQLPAYKEPVQLDNTSLLLYFGAFLLVASVGLFIAFGGAEAHVRTFAVFVVMAILYGSGVWLFKNRPKLRQAGIAFSAVGIVIAPLVGMAAYAYIFDKTHGPAVWLLTSLCCGLLYTHALKTFRQPLLGYLLIATFLSLFEAGVKIVDTPVYYLAWGLALCGILLSAAHRLKGFWPELDEPSRNSSEIVVPLGIVGALFLVPSEGALQFGISLLLASLYYGLEATGARNKAREDLTLVSHVLGLFGITTVAFGITHSLVTAGIVLGMVNLLQLIFVYAGRRETALWHQAADVLIVSSIATVILTESKPRALLAALAQALVINMLIWFRQRQALAYGLASLAWLAIPLVVGQMLLSPHWDGLQQSLANLGALGVLLVAYYMSRRAEKLVVDWRAWALGSYHVGVLVVLVAAWFASPLVAFGCALAVIAFEVALAEIDNEPLLIDAVWVLLLFPFVQSWDDAKAALVVRGVGLLVLIALALKYRRESLRWSSTVLWILLVPALAAANVGGEWTSTTFAGAYLLACYGLILSRAIARGVILASNKIPLTSYARSASYSYVIGYIVAGIVAFGFSLDASNSQTVTTLLVALLTATVLFLVKYIEKRPHGLVVVPFMLQVLLWSVVRPDNHGVSLTAFVLLSSALAAIGYWFAAQQVSKVREPEAATLITGSTLLALFIAPGWAIVSEHVVLAMPIALAVAGIAVCYHVRDSSQNDRELAGAIITLAVLWALGVVGVHELQVYMYVIVTTLGMYAYWRTTRGEHEQADTYLWWMLGISTIPLGLQAMGGLAGGLYGWWFLLQQIVIMLLGMSIGKSFVTRWGLYAAVAAVLYQLRGLGYAALAVLAVFLIGLAVYQLNKHGDK